MIMATIIQNFDYTLTCQLKREAYLIIVYSLVLPQWYTVHVLSFSTTYNAVKFQGCTSNQQSHDQISKKYLKCHNIQQLPNFRQL